MKKGCQTSGGVDDDDDNAKTKQKTIWYGIHRLGIRITFKNTGEKRGRRNENRL
jgi:hypothetical protein